MSPCARRRRRCAKNFRSMADNLLTALCLASQAPLVIAPAMNQQMWRSEATQKNIEILFTRANVSFCGPGEGEQACGDIGPGRMAEPFELLTCCVNLFAASASDNELSASQSLKNKRVMITAGPTIEDIDPVRYVSNRSSGKMGYAIAQAAQQQGAEVILVSGPVALNAPDNIQLIQVRSAQQMHEAVFKAISRVDIFIGTAAVADYRPIKKRTNKIKKNADNLTIELLKNPDILADVAALADKPITIGFAAETNDIEKYAIDKLKRKNLDMIAANKVGGSEGFEADHNELYLFWHNQKGDNCYKKLAYASKKQIAVQLIAEMVLLFIHEDTNKL